MGDCYGRAHTTLGSSSQWASTATAVGMLDSDCGANPSFCNWNKVWMVYCDGNSFSGMRDAPVVYNGMPLYFRGRYIISAIMAAVASGLPGWTPPQPFSAAYDIVLTGCSAGGLATYLHADMFAATYVAPNRPPPPGGPSRNGRFWVIPISGFFLDQPNVVGVPVYSEQMAVIFDLANSTHGVNDACIAGEAAAPWHCNMAQYTYKYIKSPIFPLNSLYDSWQSGCIMTAEPVALPNNTAANGNCSAVPGWAACADNPESCTTAQMPAYNTYRAAFINDMNATVTAQLMGNGGFLVSCHTHCEAQSSAWNTFAIGGVTMQQAVTAWMNSGGEEPAAEFFHWDCQYNVATSPHNCNPTCGA